ncbi:hypothetical protein SAMN04487848_0594 [Microbacterium sp. ru370.1]|uniref:hypothetical protein n=1 Tax=unclassified Microbacterium TaxID=2609290 RepID=UPI0008927579|nr:MULTISPECIES: hypothetical protein [unclassified Microbacterium]SDO36465.1 hypothetical protein SAMN04487848_0594 [Microbacterium sp. ru370.1]SIT78128.1 hypothetical protein SAMN05880579_0589 [Microbacterium sp. RU1D]
MNGSAPSAGVAVTVSLSDGYTFAGGATSYAGTTDASGKVLVPTIFVPRGAPSTVFTATSSGAVGTASSSGTPGVGSYPLIARRVSTSAQVYAAMVIATDGYAYTCSFNRDTGAWDSWNRLAMANTTFLTASTDGNQAFQSDGTVVSTIEGTNSPALPAGITVTQLFARRASESPAVYSAIIIGSDDRAYGCDFYQDYNVWQSAWSATAMTGVAYVAASTDGLQAFESDGITVSTLGGKTAPALPGSIALAHPC